MGEVSRSSGRSGAVEAFLGLPALAVLWSLVAWIIWRGAPPGCPSFLLPMAPLTLLGMGTLGWALAQAHRGRKGPGWAAVLVGGLAAAILACRLLGREFPLEPWLVGAPTPVPDFTRQSVKLMGRMSPVTAVLLLVLAPAPLLLRNQRRHAAALAGAACAVAGAVLLGFASGVPLVAWPGFNPAVLLSPAAALSLGLGTLAAAGSWWPRRTLFPAPLAIFLGVAALVAAAAVGFLRVQKGLVRQGAETQLAAIADLKVQEVARWAQERLNDARFLAQAPGLRRALLAGRGRDEAVVRWLEALREQHGYALVSIHDARGRARLWVAADPADPGPGKAESPPPATAAEVVVVDLHQGPGRPGGARMCVWAPVPGPAGGPRIGTVHLEVDPARHLFVQLGTWPVPSASAETLLVRRDGNEVVFLSWTRHRAGSSPVPRQDLAASPDLPAAQAVLGRRGEMAGLDYRGVLVLAALRGIPGTPWCLVAKVDMEEVFGPLRTWGWLTLVLALGALALTALAIRLQLRHVDARHLARQLDLERAAKTLGERYRHIMNEANDAILVLDGERRILEANLRAQEMLGITVPGEAGRGLAELVAPAVLASFQDGLGELARDGSARFETRFRGPGGGTFPAQVSGRLVELDGRSCTILLVQDITERVAREAEIQRLTRLYETLSQVNQAIVRVEDADSLLGAVCQVVLDHGDFVHAWIGRYEPEASRVRLVAQRGRTPEALAQEEFALDPEQPFPRPATQAFREGRTVIVRNPEENPHLVPARERLRRLGVVVLGLFPVRRGGAVWGVLGVASADAGALGAREAELMEKAALDVSFALDHLDEVACRARSEEERRALQLQLYQAQRLESLGRLAGGVAHDLNNVLGAILGRASAERAGLAPDSPQARSLDLIVTACLRGRGVVKSLLYFARRDLEEPEAVDLNALVRDLVDLLAHTTLQRIRFELDLQEPLPAVRGDAGALSNALMNLCVNAADAMPGGGTLTLGTGTLPGNRVAVRVRDTGEGMSPEVREKALDPFFTTKPAGQGTGLGLSMVFGTTQAHGGTLEIASAPGRGTEITLGFPALAEPPDLAPAPAERPEPPAPEESLSILLVDDDPLILDSVAPMLEAMGHRVATAAGGLQALRLLEAGLAVDLAILDMNMPGLSGPETLPRILALRPGLRVLLATGFRDAGVDRLLHEHPGLACIPKPFSMAELRQRLADPWGPAGATPGR